MKNKKIETTDTKYSQDICELSTEQLAKTTGGNYTPGNFKDEALAFLKSCLGEEEFSQILMTTTARQHPYVAAKLFLSPIDWEKYIWIEQHGSLDGFI